MNTRTRTQRIKNAVADLLDITPYYGHVVGQLPISIEKHVQTAQTNGTTIQFGEEFTDKLSDEELNFVLLHEVLHIVYKHPTKEHLVDRRGTRETQKWHLATDFVINNEICEFVCDRLVFPEGGAYDPKFAGLSIEEVYDLLEKDEEEQGQEGHTPMDALLQMSDKELTGLVGVMIEAGVKVGYENIPPQHRGVWVFQPPSKLSWATILTRYVGNATSKHDYSFRKPSRRSTEQFLLPAMISDSVRVVDIAIDTSGSINAAQLHRFLDECAKIPAYCDEVRVLCCDTQVYNPTTMYSSYQIKKYQTKGGGGTDFRPVFDRVKQTDLLIYFTDAEGTFPDKAPPYPVLWVLWNKANVPFGHSVVLPK